VLHAIDLGGVRSDSEVAASRGAGPGTDSLYALAAATGGELVGNSNQLPAELAKLSDRTAPNYLLSYQPAGLKKPGTFHELKVAALASGAKVTARSGYTEPLPFAALTPVERVLSAGDLLASAQDTAGLPLGLVAAPFAFEPGRAQVPVVLEVPGAALLEGV